jgi:DNA-binding NarL/FixJ family response regulator
MSTRIRVVVVEDTDHVRQMLTAMLDVDGFEVVGSAGDGSAAVAAVADLKPDVVIVDYKMPAVDGLETARRIRRQRPDQPIILYSAFIDDEVAQAAEEAGITLCLGKVEGLANLEREIARLGHAGGAPGGNLS